MLRIFCFLRLQVAILTVFSTALIFADVPPSMEKVMIECRNDNPMNGFFHRMMRIVEWIFFVKQEEKFGLYVNMHNCYGFKGNAFTVFFKEIDDDQITTSPQENCMLQRNNFPPKGKIFKRYYLTEGMKKFANCPYLYSNVAFLKDPDFATLRERLYPTVATYFQLQPDLQERVDAVLQKMNAVSSKSVTKIGIQVRCIEHYAKYPKFPDEFLDDIEKDVEKIMRLRDPKRTCLFLATLLEPVVERLSAKYNVVVCDVPRNPGVMGDWTCLKNANELDQARDAIVDTWCLAFCDELWATSSNMTIFAGCLNPDLKIRMLPSLENYNGN